MSLTVIPQGLATPVKLSTLSAPAAAKPAPGAWDAVKDSIAEKGEDWSLVGKKLGTLGVASAVLFYTPTVLDTLLPAISGMAYTPLGTAAALVLCAIEEKHIGIGKHAGQLVGLAAGSAAGAVEGLVRKATGHNASPDTHIPYELQTRPATGAAPEEALLPKLLHMTEQKTLGHVPERTRTTEMAEGIGILAAQALGATALPAALAFGVGGPIGFMAGTLVAPLLAMVAMGVEENAIGVGRLTGELVATGLNALHKPKPAVAKAAAPVDTSSNADGIGKKAWKGFMRWMGTMSEPIIGFLLDTTEASNNLFRIKPYETIRFATRPEPTVDKARLQDNFIKLAGINGSSNDEQKIGAELTAQLNSMGIANIMRKDGTIVATLPGTVADAPTVVLSSHQDTVSPTSPESIRTTQRRIMTDGTHVLGGDDRAGCAEILEGVRSVLEQKLDRPEIKIVFTVGEEIGLHGAAALRPEDVSTRPALGFVCDSTDIDSIYLQNDPVIVTPNSVKYNFSQEDPLVQVAMRSMSNAGTKIKLFASPVMAGAGSDANTPGFNRGNIRSLAVGAGENDIHTTLENIKKDDLTQGAQHVVGYITNACDLKVDGNNIVARQPVK